GSTGVGVVIHLPDGDQRDQRDRGQEEKLLAFGHPELPSADDAGARHGATRNVRKGRERWITPWSRHDYERPTTLFRKSEYPNGSICVPDGLLTHRTREHQSSRSSSSAIQR